MNKQLIQRWKSVVPKVSEVVSWYGYESPTCASEVERVEKIIGQPLPELLKQLLLECSRSWQWRDEDYDVIFCLPEEIIRDTIQPDEEVQEIVVSTSLSDNVHPYFYSNKRLCFAYSDYYRFQVDNDPTPNGKSGQIVVIDHDEQTIDVVAASLEEFVDHGLSCLEHVIEEGEYPDDIY